MCIRDRATKLFCWICNLERLYPQPDRCAYGNIYPVSYTHLDVTLIETIQQQLSEIQEEKDEIEAKRTAAADKKTCLLYTSRCV